MNPVTIHGPLAQPSTRAIAQSRKDPTPCDFVDLPRVERRVEHVFDRRRRRTGCVFCVQIVGADDADIERADIAPIPIVAGAASRCRRA